MDINNSKKERLDVNNAKKESQASNQTIRSGFFNSVAVRQAPLEHNVEIPRKSKYGLPGIVIDVNTGLEIDPKELVAEEDNENIILSGKNLEPEPYLMEAMENPPETNPHFDTAKYLDLLTKNRRDAETMLKMENGPTLEYMQRVPLELLRNYPQLDPNWCDPKNHGCSLVQYAGSVGYLGVMLQLLEKRGNPNHKSIGGVSCLAAAIAHNWLGCSRALLENHADVNEVLEPELKKSVLMWVCKTEYCDEDGRSRMNPFVSLLLEFSANVNFIDNRGQTALIQASQEGNVKSVEALLAARADSDVIDMDGETALQKALRYGHGRISSMLMQRTI